MTTVNCRTCKKAVHWFIRYDAEESEQDGWTDLVNCTVNANRVDGFCRNCSRIADAVAAFRSREIKNANNEN